MNIKQLPNIVQIDAKQWNNLVGKDDPFIRHEFLAALEQSGCVCRATGWHPQHLVVFADKRLVACMPLYLKQHSKGEYVFDYQWSNAYHEYGMTYYPKWVTAVPFTPCQGKRIYTATRGDSIEIVHALIAFLQETAAYQSISSWHCLFPPPEQAKMFSSLGLLHRHDVQFHWYNKNYRDFNDFLDTFSARNRKKINRERRRIKELGIELLRIPGTAVTDTQLQKFFQFYKMTYLKKGMQAYLNTDFFNRIMAAMPEQLLMVLATKGGAVIGAALCFVGTETLYGRYWGCFEAYPGLHFETCYYQGVEYCIANNLQKFDAGAQGEHKISRGFEPTLTHSLHWFRHPEFSLAIDHFLAQERRAIERYAIQAKKYLPFKKDGAGQ